MLFPVATTMTNAPGTTGLVTAQIITTNMSILKVITSTTVNQEKVT